MEQQQNICLSFPLNLGHIQLIGSPYFHSCQYKNTYKISEFEEVLNRQIFGCGEEEIWSTKFLAPT